MDHISYSQFRQYTSCPRSWYLSKVRKAEPKMTWYIIAGSTVHDAIELKLGGGEPDIRAIFYAYVVKQRLIEPDTSKWLAGGPKADPVIEEKAVQLALDCYEKALEYLDEIDVWEVEYDASGRLPGLSVSIKAYVDIIGEHKKQGPVIWDWKTGSTKPGNFQLETYVALLKEKYMWKGTIKGRYVMLAPGKPVTRHVDLSEVDPEAVGKKYQKVYDQMQQKLYPAKAGFDCGFCFNQDNCLVNAGMTKRAVYFDKSEEDGYPFSA